MARGLENHESAGAPDSGFAVDDDVARARNVVEARGQRRERNVDGSGERPCRDLVRLAHVEEKRDVRPLAEASRPASSSAEISATTSPGRPAQKASVSTRRVTVGRRTAHRARGVLLGPDRAHLHAERVHEEEAADEGLAHAEEES